MTYFKFRTAIPSDHKWRRVKCVRHIRQQTVGEQKVGAREESQAGAGCVQLNLIKVFMKKKERIKFDASYTWWWHLDQFVLIWILRLNTLMISYIKTVSDCEGLFLLPTALLLNISNQRVEQSCEKIQKIFQHSLTLECPADDDKQNEISSRNNIDGEDFMLNQVLDKNWLYFPF